MSVSVLLALCPSCPPNLEARSLVLSEAFWINAAYAVLPFVVVGLVVQRFVKHLDHGASREDIEAADVPWSGRLLVGAMLGGWGLFNFVEGLIDHQMLGLHHVHPGANQLAWDLGFVLLGGVGLMLLGTWIGRSGRTASPALAARLAPS